jgi:hypothetical protein
VRDIVVHRSGLEMDLSAPTPEDERLLRRIHDDIGRTPRGELQCRTHGGDLYLVTRRRDATMWAAHWPGTAGHFAAHSIAFMTPEHRSQVEYMQRAADRAGLPTATEVTLATRVRPDLVVAGHTALEAQHSGITIGAIKARTTKIMRGGMRSATWISDKERAPGWMGHVPAVRVFARDWMRLPDPGEAEVVGGLVRLGRARCCPPSTLTCPETSRRYCGQWHLTRQPMGGATLDQVTVGLAVGDYVPVRIRGYAFLADRSEAEKFDAPLWTPPPARARLLRAADRVECRADRPDTAEAVCCGERWMGEQGKPLIPSCMLCPKSATYWRNSA